jgi:hypothetical protein
MFERQNRTQRVFVSGKDPQRVATALASLRREASARRTAGLIVVPGGAGRTRIGVSFKARPQAPVEG